MSVSKKRDYICLEETDTKQHKSHSSPALKKQKISNTNYNNKNTHIENENELKTENSNEEITLNVGGIKYTITKQILHKYESILQTFTAVSNDIYTNNKNGELWKYILEYMETQTLKLPETWNKTNIWNFYIEAKYYKIEPLLDEIILKLFDITSINKYKQTIVYDYISNKDINSLILYNPFGSILMYHSKSKDVSPGIGTKETLSNMDNFDELIKIKNWRKILSNFYQLPNKQKLFDLDGLSWISVEHYFQAAKFKQINLKYYKSFSLDSGSKLSKGDGKDAKKAGGKKGFKLDNNTLRNWDLRKHGVMQNGLLAKYKQNKSVAKVLMMTKNAKLLHSPGRIKPMVEYDLMIVRNYLFG
eukprot:285722_1